MRSQWAIIAAASRLEWPMRGEYGASLASSMHSASCALKLDLHDRLLRHAEHHQRDEIDRIDDRRLVDSRHDALPQHRRAARRSTRRGPRSVELDRSPARLDLIEHVLEPDRLAEAHLYAAEALA